MNLSLDYDDTYTRDPKFWNKFCQDAKAAGHTVYCVTARNEYEITDVYLNLAPIIGEENIFYTSRKAKKSYMYARRISIDVWIDDNPFNVNHDL